DRPRHDPKTLQSTIGSSVIWLCTGALCHRLWLAGRGGAENLLERTPQRDIDVGQPHRMPKIDQAADAAPQIGAAAGHDRGVMRQVRLDIDGYAGEGDPALQPNADRGDLALVACALAGTLDPDAAPALPPLAADIERGKCADDPFFQCRNIGADIGLPPLQV